MILPTKAAREAGKGAKRSLHEGRHLQQYVDDVEKKLFELMRRNEAGEITNAEVKEAIEKMQGELQKGLKDGTIVLQQADLDALKAGEAIGVAGLATIVPETAADEIDHVLSYACPSAYIFEEGTWAHELGSMLDPIDEIRGWINIFGIVAGWDKPDTGKYEFGPGKGFPGPDGRPVLR